MDGRANPEDRASPEGKAKAPPVIEYDTEAT